MALLEKLLFTKMKLLEKKMIENLQNLTWTQKFKNVYVSKLEHLKKHPQF